MKIIYNGKVFFILQSDKNTEKNFIEIVSLPSSTTSPTKTLAIPAMAITTLCDTLVRVIDCINCGKKDKGDKSSILINIHIQHKGKICLLFRINFFSIGCHYKNYENLNPQKLLTFSQVQNNVTRLLCITIHFNGFNLIKIRLVNPLLCNIAHHIEKRIYIYNFNYTRGILRPSLFGDHFIT